MIDAARARGITTIVAGSDATDHPATLSRSRRRRRRRRRRRGDAGRAARHAAAGARRRGALDASVDGLCLRDADGRDRPHAARATIIRDLDALPLPAWDLVDVERYRSIVAARATATSR